MLAVFKNLGKVNCLGMNDRWGTVCTPTAMVISVKPSSLRAATFREILRNDLLNVTGKCIMM